MDIPEASIRIIPQVLDVLNNGHTIQVNVDGRDTLTLGENSFDLLQLHFHAPSEHTVDGHQYAMEMHLVHENAGTELAVVGVFIEEGAYNAAFDPILNNMPSAPGNETLIGPMPATRGSGRQSHGRRSRRVTRKARLFREQLRILAQIPDDAFHQPPVGSSDTAAVLRGAVLF